MKLYPIVWPSHLFSFVSNNFWAILQTFQIKVQIDGTEVHTIVPQGNARSIGMDNGETKKFCTAGKHSIWDSLSTENSKFLPWSIPHQENYRPTTVECRLILWTTFKKRDTWSKVSFMKLKLLKEITLGYPEVKNILPFFKSQAIISVTPQYS